MLVFWELLIGWLYDKVIWVTYQKPDSKSFIPTFYWDKEELLNVLKMVEWIGTFFWFKKKNVESVGSSWVSGLQQTKLFIYASR